MVSGKDIERMVQEASQENALFADKKKLTALCRVQARRWGGRKRPASL